MSCCLPKCKKKLLVFGFVNTTCAGIGYAIPPSVGYKSALAKFRIHFTNPWQSLEEYSDSGATTAQLGNTGFGGAGERVFVG
jgi:hypothetical protein